jgi:hypothetical protein
MLNLARNLRIARALNAVAAGQTDQNGGIIDMANYEGVVFIAALGTLASGAVTGLKAQMGYESKPLGCCRPRRNSSVDDRLMTTNFWSSTSIVRPIRMSGPL